MINVTSEIMPLRRVLLHRPSNEILQITPDNLDKLLFDDIPYLNIMQKEHDELTKMFKSNKIEVLYLEDLMTEVLDNSPELREKFIKQFIYEAGIKTPKYKNTIIKYLNEFTKNKDLVLKTMEGIKVQELSMMEIDLNHSLTDLVTDDETFLIEPMPNLLFCRDNITPIHNGVSLNKMHYPIRQRENIYYEYIFNYHEEYKNIEKYYDRFSTFSIEGGDIFNISDHILAVGISKRTEASAIEELAKNLFSSENNKIDTILAFNIPNEIHLDSIFTQIDYDKFLYYPGMINNLKVFEIRKDVMEGLRVKEINNNLENILETYLSRDVMLIPCGGGDKVISSRELWNGGINVLCISPGVVVSYNRNNITNSILRKYGVTVYEIPSSELSRGRGGVNSMIIPLIRINE